MCLKPRQHHSVQIAFYALLCWIDYYFFNMNVSKEVVYMPMQSFLSSSVPCYTCFESSQSTAGVYITPGGEVEYTESSDLYPRFMLKKQD